MGVELLVKWRYSCVERQPEIDGLATGLNKWIKLTYVVFKSVHRYFVFVSHIYVWFIRSTTCNTMASLPTWCTDNTFHHSQRLNEPAVKGGVWDGLPQLAHSHCSVFSCRDFCGSTAVGMPDSVGMNGQIDWQAQQIWHLVCCLAGQRCSGTWGTFWTWIVQSIAALITWRKEDLRKEAANIPPSEVRNYLCSTRLTLALFWGPPWGNCWEVGWSAYGPFQALRCHLELKLNWNNTVLLLSCSCFPTAFTSSL